MQQTLSKSEMNHVSRTLAKVGIECTDIPGVDLVLSFPHERPLDLYPPSNHVLLESPDLDLDKGWMPLPVLIRGLHLTQDLMQEQGDDVPWWYGTQSYYNYWQEGIVCGAT